MKRPTANFAAMAILCSFSLFACEETEDSGVDAGPPNAFTDIYNSATFQECSGCHAPGAPGKVDGTEENLNFSTRDAAYASLQGTASGLIGNFTGCNGVPFVGSTSGASLIVAVFDENVRANFDVSGFPSCNMDSISDMTLNLDVLPSASLLADLKAWIDDGAPN